MCFALLHKEYLKFEKKYKIRKLYTLKPIFSNSKILRNKV